MDGALQDNEDRSESVSCSWLRITRWFRAIRRRAAFSTASDGVPSGSLAQCRYVRFEVLAGDPAQSADLDAPDLTAQHQLVGEAATATECGGHLMDVQHQAGSRSVGHPFSLSGVDNLRVTSLLPSLRRGLPDFEVSSPTPVPLRHLLPGRGPAPKRV